MKQNKFKESKAKGIHTDLHCYYKFLKRNESENPKYINTCLQLRFHLWLFLKIFYFPIIYFTDFQF